MNEIVGIDLGTTNSLIAVVDGGKPVCLPDAQGDAIVPSVVHYAADGSIVVGAEARDQLAAQFPNNFVPGGTGSLTVPEPGSLAALIIPAGLLTRVCAGLLASAMAVALIVADRAAFWGALKGTSEAQITDIASFVFLLFLFPFSWIRTTSSCCRSWGGSGSLGSGAWTHRRLR